MPHKIMRMAVAAGRHHKSLTGMINKLGPSRFNKSFGSLPVADIDVPAVLYGKCFRKLIAFGGEDFTVDHEIGTGLAVERKLAHL